MFDGHKNFGGSLLNFNYFLVDAKGYDKESVKDFHSRLLRVIMMLEKSKNSAEFIDVIGTYQNELLCFTDEELRIFNAAVTILDEVFDTNVAEALFEAIKSANAEGVSGMLSNLKANEKRRARQLIK